MKMLFCRDVKLGAVCTESLDIPHLRRWQNMRTEKLNNLFDTALRENAGYLALFGRLFGQEKVPEAVIDRFFEILNGENQLQVLLFSDTDEYRRLNYRMDIPENLHLICIGKINMYTDDTVAVRTADRMAEIQLGENEAFTVSSAADSKSVIAGLPDGEKIIPAFEPVGFEDAGNETFGYSVIDWTEEQIVKYEEKKNPLFAFGTVELRLTPVDDQKEITEKIAKLAQRTERDTFLRVDIKGKTAFAANPDADAVRAQLQNKLFHAEVYVNTVMDIDEEMFENDISLRGEFIRLALKDDSLSEAERNRLICCGWNALSGKEISE